MINYLEQYWYVLALIVLAVAFYLVKRYLKGKERSVALQYLLAAEKMVFTTTESRLSVVSDLGYKSLPKFVKAMVSPLAFELLVTSVYNEIKDLVNSLHEDKTAPVSKNPVEK